MLTAIVSNVKLFPVYCCCLCLADHIIIVSDILDVLFFFYPSFFACRITILVKLISIAAKNFLKILHIAVFSETVNVLQLGFQLIPKFFYFMKPGFTCNASL